MIFPTLYKKTATGATQTWYMEQEGSKYRTFSGQLDGKITVTEWTSCLGKNIGKKNETSPDDQAHAEVQSQYKKKLAQGNYNQSIDDIDEDNFFKPMLAKDYNDHPITPKEYAEGVYCQPKLDGMRCIAKKDGLWSRQGKPIISCPHILEALSPIFDLYPGLILDGEIYNHQLKDDFNKIMSLAKQSKPTPEDLKQSELLIQYHIYDCLLLEPDKTPFFGRMEFLAGLFFDKIVEEGILHLVETSHIPHQRTLDALYEQYIGQGYEGQIVRHNSPYANKRTNKLLKRKEFQDAEFDIVQIEEGSGNRSGMAGAITYKLPDGRLFRSGIKGGVDYYTKLLIDAESYIGGQGTVKFFQYTPDGVPRFPVTVAVYKTKRDT